MQEKRLGVNYGYEKDELGEKAVRNGEYAVVTMAGGQGTRLGHHGPKGTFKLNVYGKGKYLFEILTENLKEANKKYKLRFIADQYNEGSTDSTYKANYLIIEIEI